MSLPNTIGKSGRSRPSTMKKSTKPHWRPATMDVGPYHSVSKPEIVLPEEYIPPVLNIHKFAIKDNLKFVNLGVRPSKFSKYLVLRYIEEIYGKLCKLKSKRLYEVIQDEHTLAKFIYDHFVTEPTKPHSLQASEKILMSFIHSLETYKQESTHSMLFGQIMSGIIPVEGVGFLVDLRGFIEAETGEFILHRFNMKNGLQNTVISFVQLRNITDKVFGYGAYETRNEFLDTIKESFPDINVNYAVPYELFLNFCVQKFCSAKHQQLKSLSKEESTGMNLFNDKFEEYKVKAHNGDVDVKVWDKIGKSCHRKMKTICLDFVDLILENCPYKEKEEFEDVKVIIVDLLVKKTTSLLDSVISTNREMYFTLLTVDSPGEEDLDYFKKMSDLFSKLVRFEISNEELLEVRPGREDWEDAQECEQERDKNMVEFCKMFVVSQKMTQEICRLIIYLTSKNI